MARLKLELPAHSLFTTQIPVRITDLNYGNHVGNNAIVEIIHEARVQFLKHFGLAELQSGTSLIMSELQVEYKNESYYRDVLKISVFSGEISRVSFELFYEISTQRNEQSIIIALAKSGMVCYNYSIKKVKPVPENLKRILSGK